MRAAHFFLAAGVAVLAAAAADRTFDESLLRDGDIVFQSSRTLQSLAIRLATHSAVSHCGLVYSRGGEFFVLEASTTVRSIPFARFVKKGEGQRFAVKRLRRADSLLTPSGLERVKEEEDKFSGRPYDWFFNWDDAKIYCSELVHKIYRNSLGILLGQPKKLKDFDLSNPMVAANLREKYGDSIPWEDTVVDPASIYRDTNLVNVFDNFGDTNSENARIPSDPATPRS